MALLVCVDDIVLASSDNRACNKFKAYLNACFSIKYAGPFKKGSLGTLVRGVPCDLKVTGSSRGIGHWKQVRPPTIHLSRCGLSLDPAYVGCFVHRAALFLMLGLSSFF